jgi:uncharacterized membrane protein YfcA
VTIWLPAAVLAMALLYASVGHAGATGYIAVMTLAGLPPEVVRPTALVLNVCVATIATVTFARAGHLRRDLLVPLAIASVPAAFVGGSIGLPPAVFGAVVAVVLAAAAVRLAGRVAAPRRAADESVPRRPAAATLAAIGGAIGLLSGLTGVGGGVFLSPALIAMRAAPLREVAAVSAAFILVNSIAGLAGGVVVGRAIPPVSLSVVAAAVVGGAVGSHLGAVRLPVRALEGVMAVVLAVAAANLVAPLVRGS